MSQVGKNSALEMLYDPSVNMRKEEDLSAFPGCSLCCLPRSLLTEITWTLASLGRKNADTEAPLTPNSAKVRGSELDGLSRALHTRRQDCFLKGSRGAGRANQPHSLGERPARG